MKKVIFDIVGLRHHDFKDRLDELFDTVIGRQVMLMLEKNNEGQVNAVIAYIGSKCLGHVSRLIRRLALSALYECDEDDLYATVVEVDRVRKHLYVELEVADSLEPDMTEEPNVLTDWSYDGPELIRESADAGRLRASMKQLTRLIKLKPDAWTDEMEELLLDIGRLMVHDISAEMNTAIARLDQMLMALSVGNKAFREAMQRLEFFYRELATDPWREALAQSVRDLAVSKEMSKLLKRLGTDAPAVAAKLPQALICELHIDLGMLLSHISYWDVPRVKVQQVRCLLALNLRLEQDGVPRYKGRKKAAAPGAKNSGQEVIGSESDEYTNLIDINSIRRAVISRAEHYDKRDDLHKFLLEINDILEGTAWANIREEVKREAFAALGKNNDPISYNINHVDSLAPNASTVTNNHYKDNNG